jgi:XTP/dITP diphosphohydrolase
MTINDVIIATGNSGKLQEIREIFSEYPIRFTSLKDYWNPVPDIPETGNTFLENARMKANWVFSRKNIWTLADDSGLEVDALDGEPGVLSARYAGQKSNDTANIEKLLQKMADVELKNRTARFRCVVVLTGPNTEFVSEGVCEGHIGFTGIGTKGFGYDPLFIPEGFDRTFAELTNEEKHATSHRGRALADLTKKIDELL